MNRLSQQMRWWKKFKAAGAVWQHSGNPQAPHVVLRSGNHSDGFINTLQFLHDMDNLVAAASALGDKMATLLKPFGQIEWIFGSPMAGIPFATMFAWETGISNIGFTEKVLDDSGGKKLVCRFDVPAGDKVLVIEEMTTTGGTPQRAIDAIRIKNPGAEIVPVVGAFLDRCGPNPPGLGGAKLVSVISLPELGIHFNEWKAGECPLCKVGSRPIENCKRVWDGLLAAMTDPTHSVPAH